MRVLDLAGYVLALYVVYMSIAVMMLAFGPLWNIITLLYIIMYVPAVYKLGKADASVRKLLLFSFISLGLSIVSEVLLLDAIRRSASFPLVYIIRGGVTAMLLYVAKVATYDSRINSYVEA